MTLTPRMTGVLAVLLVISIAANFFTAGIFVSNFHRFHGFGPLPFDRHAVALHVRDAPKGLSADGISKLVDAMRANPDAVKAIREELRAARDKARDVLRQDPFDVEAFKAAQKDVAEIGMKAQMAMQDRIADVAANLSPEDRKALADMTADGRLDVTISRGGPGGPGFVMRRLFMRGDDGLPPGAPRDFMLHRQDGLPPAGVAPESPPPPEEDR